ncbi:hypothetical protein DPMN_041295 [Dreissena polymorpha]|uniref:Uncharacterized protein n=1 Tax=Dreissena polymorpha TaxID=45954 RepID=A0A9D4HTT3_DREPO|nr:hypothetical protein DPMN_041295 [Dreissena polymorpha]
MTEGDTHVAEQLRNVQQDEDGDDEVESPAISVAQNKEFKQLKNIVLIKSN